MHLKFLHVQGARARTWGRVGGASRIMVGVIAASAITTAALCEESNDKRQTAVPNITSAAQAAKLAEDHYPNPEVSIKRSNHSTGNDVEHWGPINITPSSN